MAEVARRGRRFRRLPPGQVVTSRPEGVNVNPVDHKLRINVVSNRYAVKMSKDMQWYQYEIRYDERLRERRAEKDRILEMHVQALKKQIANCSILTGNRVLYSTAELFPVSAESNGCETFPFPSGHSEPKPEWALTLKFIKRLEARADDPAFRPVVGLGVRHLFKILGMTSERGCYFDKRAVNPSHQLRDQLDRFGLEMFAGYESAVYANNVGDFLLTVNAVTRVKHCNSLLDDLHIRPDEPVSGRRKNDVLQLIGQMVEVTYAERSFKIDDIYFNEEPPYVMDLEKQVFSSLINGVERTTNMVDYFRDVYGVRVSPQQPFLIVSKPKRRQQNRSRAEAAMAGHDADTAADMAVQPILLPPQLVRLMGIPDEAINDKNGFMRAFTAYGRKGPEERIDLVQGLRRRLYDVEDELQKLGWTISEEPAKISAGVLASELLMMKQRGQDARVTLENQRGEPSTDWTGKFRGDYELLISYNLDRWIVLVANREDQLVNELTRTLDRVARGLQIRVSPPGLFRISGADARQFSMKLEEALGGSYNNGRKPQIVVVVLPNEGEKNMKAIYDTVKTSSLTNRIVVPTQFVKSTTLSGRGGRGRGGGGGGGGGMDLSVATKILIQMQTKMGGAPWSLVNPKFRGLIVGYDLNKDALHRGQMVTAMVGTYMNVNPASQYFSVAEMLERGEQLSTKTAVMFRKVLENYRKLHDGQLPDRVIVFRDGISEGQVEQLKDVEVNGFRQVLASIAPSTKLTFLICKKTCNARFLHEYSRQDENRGFSIQRPRRGRGGRGGFGGGGRGGRGGYGGGNGAGGGDQLFNGQPINPPPGTVVDSIITRPELYDFYLVPQTVGQGTVTPSHYNVIHDDSKWPAERLQMLTYKLCHMYFNWTGTIRVPSVCQYARKLAQLVSTSIHQPITDPDIQNTLYYL